MTLTPHLQSNFFGLAFAMSAVADNDLKARPIAEGDRHVWVLGPNHPIQALGRTHSMSFWNR